MKYIIDDIIVSKNDIDEDFECSFCCSIMLNPRSCLNSHIYCLNCWEKQMEIKKQCPSCAVPVTIDTLCKNKFLEKHINMLKIYCPNSYYNNNNNNNSNNNNNNNIENQLILDKSNGCKEIINIESLESHLRECQFQFIDCPNNKKCGMYRKNQMEQHQGQCGYLKISCYHCMQDIERQFMGEHILNECNDITVQCRYSEGGCQAMIPRNQLAAHLSEFDNHREFIENIIKGHQKKLKSTFKELDETNSKLDQLKISSESLETNLINNDYSYRGKWIIKQWNYHYEMFIKNPIKNLIISPPIYLSPTKEFSLSLTPTSTINNINCLSIHLEKLFQTSSIVQFSFEIINYNNTKSIKKEEKKRFKHYGAAHAIEFPVSEIYNINNKYIQDDELEIIFTIKILSVEETEQSIDNVLITEKEN
ncbi:hypothetical protein DICPUDRAFT_31439 [Dictyostelium purpureum]|uniref:TRAF-type domain-containing protein n=1 Tax=Dictyostelium purpureum TaxID=5786 RepID=F0ZH89_DICPU|nr:uncharacterized protein DICPUDRAFT_31439 [Dictyostelium purpureum]EGC36681.1 hypothetical protein DICPUDRAFT_31439 [Dictyostelium purpureum]|eukprot:XP_003286780.1 hypothetical protein DICPUDRAFT_31439 [Dictyostelium purpureum]